MHCLDREPHRRPASMKLLEEKLRAIAETLSVELEQYSPAPARGRRLPRTLFAAAGVAVAAVGILLAVGLASGDSRALPELAVPAPAPATEPPPPAPAPPPEVTPLAATIEIHFDSAPRGAQVFARSDPAKPLGVTPFVLTREVSSGSEKFVFRLPGYQDAEDEIALADNARVKVSLARTVKRVRPTTATRSKTKGTSGDDSPFELKDP
jgi:hypothetical protein